MVWSGDFGGGWVSAHAGSTSCTTLCLSSHPQLTHPDLCLCNWLSNMFQPERPPDPKWTLGAPKTTGLRAVLACLKIKV